MVEQSSLLYGRYYVKRVPEKGKGQDVLFKDVSLGTNFLQLGPNTELPIEQGTHQ
jgi:hypothetical protein